ncbi:hypothetical protein CSQ89_20750 [Chitinimonas sp. BJB300]|nr:hypothetical protein CSQ89_20750 [Chitinimonas sp. BJB300]TSJ82540.1 hypothetical protein FG002_022155 [Chitinimonas sp. BJB300]
MDKDGRITDNHDPKRSAVSPVFLHQLLSPQVAYALDRQDHQFGVQDWLGNISLSNQFTAWTNPGWLTHKSDPDQPTYRFQLEEIDLANQPMKNSMFFSTGEAMDGVLPSGAKLVDAFGDNKFSTGSIGLRTHIILPANTPLQNSNVTVSKDDATGLYCFFRKVPLGFSPIKVGLKLVGDSKVEVYKVTQDCKPDGASIGEGQYRQTQTKGLLSTQNTHYFFSLPASLNVESQLFNSTYLKAGAKLVITQMGYTITPEASAYFDKETKIVDPQIHFNKAAITELKTQLGLPQ